MHFSSLDLKVLYKEGPGVQPGIRHISSKETQEKGWHARENIIRLGRSKGSDNKPEGL